MATTPLHGWPLPEDREALLELFLRDRLTEIDAVTGINHASPVSITVSTTLTSAAFFKSHVCSGTSVDYTVTLPTPTSADVGKLIHFRMSNALTKTVTLDAGAGRSISGRQTRAMTRDEALLLLCVGTSGVCWATLTASDPPPVWGRIHSTAAQAISSATETAISFNAESYDTDGWHDNATNNTRATCRTAGLYVLRGGLEFAASAAGSMRIVRLRVNGSTIYAITQTGPAGGGNSTATSVTAIITLAVNDYVELIAYQDSGASLNTVATVTNYGAQYQYAPVLEWAKIG